MRTPVIEIFKDTIGKFRFRVMSTNYKIVCQSEGYTTKAMCKKGLQTLDGIFFLEKWCLRDLTKKEKEKGKT